MTVAFADCVFAAEYPKGSGTEIAVKKAIELQKPLFTLYPQPGTRELSSGSDHLITDRFACPLDPKVDIDHIRVKTNDFYSITLAILFDLDGVLVDTRKLESEVLRSTIHELVGEAPTEESSPSTM